MKRFALVLTCAMILSGSGCCLCPFGGGGYGAGYSPTYGGGGGGCPPSACPTGQQYPGGYGAGYPGAYNGGAPTAVVPYGYPQTTYIDPLPIN